MCSLKAFREYSSLPQIHFELDSSKSIPYYNFAVVFYGGTFLGSQVKPENCGAANKNDMKLADGIVAFDSRAFVMLTFHDRGGGSHALRYTAKRCNCVEQRQRQSEGEVPHQKYHGIALVKSA